MAAALVVVERNAGTVNGKWKVEVGIVRAFSIALALPHAGDLDGGPFGGIFERLEVFGMEISGTLERRLGKVEKPFPGEELGLSTGRVPR